MATATLTLTDEQIQTDVLDELKWEPRVRPNEIGVAVEDGVVTLTGWVDSYTKRWAAEDAAHRVHGVKAVANSKPKSTCRVRPSVPTPTLTRSSHQCLGVGRIRTREMIDVTVSKAGSPCKGEVEWQYEKEDAERVVRRLSGVKGVTNLIIVRPRATPSEMQEEDRRCASAQRGS